MVGTANLEYISSSSSVTLLLPGEKSINLDMQLTLPDNSVTSLNETKSIIDESGFHEHNMLVYRDLEALRETYCMYARQHLEPRYNEIVIIASQYETIDKVRDNLRDYGVDVEKHEKDGSLVIIDAVKGYQSDKDHLGAINLCKSLVARAEKEGKAGVCSFGDMGSFFMYDRISGLLQYEQSITPKPQFKLKAFCTYHARDYANLTKEQKNSLSSSHYRKLLPEEGNTNV